MSSVCFPRTRSPHCTIPVHLSARKLTEFILPSHLQISFPNKISYDRNYINFLSGSGSNPGLCIPFLSRAYAFNLPLSRMFLCPALPFVTLTFLKAPSQLWCNMSLVGVGLPFPHYEIHVSHLQQGDQRLIRSGLLARQEEAQSVSCCLSF